MTCRRTLVAHSSKAARSILRRRTLAEAPEFVIEEVESADELVGRLTGGNFDIVMCDEVLVGSLTRDWIAEFSSQIHLSNVGYIFLVSEATSANRRAELARSGAHAFLDARCTASDFADAIASVFDPRNRRQYRRVCIPGTNARISSASIDVGADVVNLSVAGMLCDFACPKYFDCIMLPCDITLRFPQECSTEPVDGVRARLVRMHVVSRDSEQLPERIRAAWQFIHVPKDSYLRLDAVVTQADEEVPPESRSLIA